MRHCLLNDTVLGRRDPQFSDPSIRLRYFPASYGCGMIISSHHLCLDLGEMSVHPFNRFTDSFPVRSRCSIVRPHSLHGDLHVLWSYRLFHEMFGLQFTSSFHVFRQIDAQHFRILFVFRTIPLRTALLFEIFCFHRISFLSIIYSRFILVPPFAPLPLQELLHYYGVG